MISFKQFLIEQAKYAAEEGESEIVHHTTDIKFDGKFKPLSHFGSHQAARDRAKYHKLDNRKTSIHSYSVRLKLGNVAHVGDLDDNHDASTTVMLLHHAGHITDDEYNSTLDKLSKMPDEEHKPVVDLMKKKKIDTISYTNSVEHAGSKSYIISDPSQVRVLKNKEHAKVNTSRSPPHSNNSLKFKRHYTKGGFGIVYVSKTE